MPRAFSQNRVVVVGALRLAMVFAVLVLMPLVCLNACLVATGQVEPAVTARDTTHDTLQEFVASNCLDCHSTGQPEAGFDLEAIDFAVEQFSDPNFESEVWEKILRRIAARQMPPPDALSVSDGEIEEVSQSLSSLLAERAASFPNPGRTGSVRRLTRTEYQNVIRDLVAINIDAKDFLPQDQSSHGFDNITVEELSPTLLNRYLTAAQKISRAAVGATGGAPTGVTLRIPADRTQDDHVQGLPFGTRGGTVFQFLATKTAQYEVEIKLTRDRDEKVEGLNREHEIDLLVDRQLVKRFKLTPPAGKKDVDKDFTHVDSHLKMTLSLTAGTHEIGVTFPKTASSISENKRQPFDASYNRHRHPRQAPAVFQIAVVGPFGETGNGETPSRNLIFGDEVNRPQNRDEAKSIFGRIARLAYRRPVDEQDLATPLRFFDESFDKEQDFEKAIESGLTSILVNPNMLLRVERQPVTAQPQTAYQVSDLELASRLSFFLWSSSPDDELLELAEKGLLHHRDVLEQQVQRMLASPKSISLVENFAGQWLYLKNLESITPDLRIFPDFDDNLRQAFRGETEQLFRDVMQQDLSVLQLIQSNYTFLNERLAKHYGIAGVLGSHFRRVHLPADSKRGGILRHGSVLMVTSYATRTSPTIRGNWILENIIGTAPPPPPANVPNLRENTMLNATTIRERLAAHRANPACASCHDIMDPVGFSLENYDAVGRWRILDGEFPVDAVGRLPDGQEVSSIAELESGIAARPELFVRTMTEKMLTFALGRGVEAYDGPAVRAIVANAESLKFKFSSLVTGIVMSDPFQMRNAE